MIPITEVTFKDLAPVFAAFVIGGVTLLSAISTLLVTNRNNRKAQLIQLNHDAQQKEKDRQLNLRKEIYLEIAEQITAVSYYFSSIPLIDTTKVIEEEVCIKNLHAGISKLMLVASAETVDLATKLHAMYTQVYINVLMESRPAHDLKMDFDLAEKSVSIAQREVDRTLEDMKANKIAGSDYSIEAQHLNVRLDIQTRYLNEKLAIFNQIYKEYSEILKHINININLETAKLQDIQTKVLFAVRKELGFQDNIDLEQRIKNNYEGSKEAINSYLNNIRDDD